METYIWACVGFVVGALVALIFNLWILRRKDGILWIDQRDEEKDKYNLEFSIPLNDVPKKKFVIFKIVTLCPRKNSSL